MTSGPIFALARLNWKEGDAPLPIQKAELTTGQILPIVLLTIEHHSVYSIAELRRRADGMLLGPPGSIYVAIAGMRFHAPDLVCDPNSACQHVSVIIR